MPPAGGGGAGGGVRQYHTGSYHHSSSRISQGSEGSGATGGDEATGPSRSSSGYVRGGGGNDSGGGSVASGAEANNRALYVGNLAPSVDEHVLVTQFSMYGQVISAQIIRDRETRSHRGYGFVTFASPGSAAAAISHLNGMAVAGPFQGRQLRVSPSTKSRAGMSMPL